MIQNNFQNLEILRKGSSDIPLAITGLNETLDVLNKEIPSDVPLWWFKSDGFFGPQFSIRPFAEMAASFANELRGAKSGGSLVIVGYSFGALLAIELALQLRTTHDVEVVVLEPPMPGILPSRAKRRRSVVVRNSSPNSSSSSTSPSGGETIANTIPRKRVSITKKLLQAIKSSRYRVFENLQESFLRPYLESRIRRGKSIPHRFRTWWYFKPQVHHRTVTYQLPTCTGRIHLLGRPTWLEANLPSWKVLTEGAEFEVRPIAHATTHLDIVHLPAAKDWINLVRQLLSGQQENVQEEIERSHQSTLQSDQLDVAAVDGIKKHCERGTI